EREVLNRRRFKSQAEARMAIFEWIEGWYNPHRRHSGLGYRSPVNYERAHHQARVRMAELPPPAAAEPTSGKIPEAARRKERRTETSTCPRKRVNSKLFLGESIGLCRNTVSK